MPTDQSDPVAVLRRYFPSGIGLRQVMVGEGSLAELMPAIAELERRQAVEERRDDWLDLHPHGGHVRVSRDTATGERFRYRVALYDGASWRAHADGPDEWSALSAALDAAGLVEAARRELENG